MGKDIRCQDEGDRMVCELPDNRGLLEKGVNGCLEAGLPAAKITGPVHGTVLGSPYAAAATGLACAAGAGYELGFSDKSDEIVIEYDY